MRKINVSPRNVYFTHTSLKVTSLLRRLFYAHKTGLIVKKTNYNLAGLYTCMSIALEFELLIIRLKRSLLRQGLSEPDFYGDLVYKLKRIVGSNNFSAQFIKIISHFKKIGYNINVLQQTACLVVNPITVGNFAFLFNCTPVGRTSDYLMVST